MRDNRFDPPVESDITDTIREHSGEGLVRMPMHRKRDKAKAKKAKASRKKNR